MTQTTKQVCHDHLHECIDNMQAIIERAKDCLEINELLQCAVRLQEAAEYAKFDSLLMAVFDTLSGPQEEEKK